MINPSLQLFADRVVETKVITAEDVDLLRRDVFADSVQTREEVDMLVALDRVATQADPAWAEFLTAEVVDFTVWTARPTGVVDHGAARWLVTSLSCGGGPTANAARIALEVVREAQRVDEMLVTFVLGPCRQRPDTGQARPLFAPLAA